jgi:hypothetical protein
MASLSDYMETAVINHFLRNTTVASPATVYLALYTTDPTDADTGTEVTGGAYVRIPITLTAPVNGVTKNAADVEFAVATANWGTVTHAAVRDAATGGNLLLHGPLSINKTINTGDQFRVPANQLTFTLD